MPRYLSATKTLTISQDSLSICFIPIEPIAISPSYITKAKGDYLTFLDSDDWLAYDACEKFVEILNSNHNIDIIIGKCNITANGSIKENYSHYKNDMFVNKKNELFDSIFKTKDVNFSCVDTPWAKLFSKSFIDENNLYFNEKLTNGEDGLFLFESILVANKIFFTTSIVYNYRVNISSVCNTISNDLDLRFITLAEEFDKVLTNKKVDSEKKHFNYYLVRIILRLLRKFYPQINGYKNFKKSFLKIINTPVFKNSLKEVNCEDLTKNQKLILALINKKKIFYIYLLTVKLKINLK